MRIKSLIHVKHLEQYLENDKHLVNVDCHCGLTPSPAPIPPSSLLPMFEIQFCFVVVFVLFFVLAVPRSLWDPSSPTRD